MRLEPGSTQATQFEVRCLRCNTSFAPGTRKCVHCGERLGRQPALEIARGLPIEAGEEEGEGPSSPVRALIWAVSLGLALAGSFFRMCQGG